MKSLRTRWVPAVAIASTIALPGCGMTSELTGPSLPATPYILFAPIQSNATYLMNLEGQLVHRWTADSTPACSVYLLENGQILRPRSLGAGSFPGGGCNGGRVEILDWDSRVVWSYEYFGPTFEQHHDVKRMPNGHVLMVAWEIKTAAEALAAGRSPDTIPSSDVIWVDHVIEVDPGTNRIVWEWHAWDHLLAPGAEPSEHPELIDPNARATAASDWTHVNAVDYNASLDQVMVSSRNFSEIWIVDHATTTAEAAGHAGGRRGRGGDLLFRWGSPANYGLAAPQQLFGQHNARWIDDGLPGAGQILIFNNGERTSRPYSSVVQLAPTLLADGAYAYDAAAGFLPTAPASQYVANPPDSLFAPIISGAQRLISGNTLVCAGTEGRFLEVTPAGDTAWSYTVMDTAGKTGVDVFRATRIEGDDPALAGRTLVPQAPVQAEVP
jgi:arylsulfotransferase ASST